VLFTIGEKKSGSIWLTWWV